MNLDFSKYDKVFCDSEKALNNLIKNKLKKKSKILTYSPSIISNKNYYKDFNIIDISQNWKKEQLFDYQSTKKEFFKKIYNECQNDSSISKYSILVTSYLGVSCRNIYKAGFLRDNDIKDNALFVNINQNENPLLQYINPPWKFLLKTNKNLNIFNYDIEIDNNIFLGTPSFFFKTKICRL